MMKRKIYFRNKFFKQVSPQRQRIATSNRRRGLNQVSPTSPLTNGLVILPGPMGPSSLTNHVSLVLSSKWVQVP
jgi:hypothetical protein